MGSAFARGSNFLSQFGVENREIYVFHVLCKELPSRLPSLFVSGVTCMQRNDYTVAVAMHLFVCCVLMIFTLLEDRGVGRRQNNLI